MVMFFFLLIFLCWVDVLPPGSSCLVWFLCDFPDFIPSCCPCSSFFLFVLPLFFLCFPFPSLLSLLYTPFWFLFLFLVAFSVFSPRCLVTFFSRYFLSSAPSPPFLLLSLVLFLSFYSQNCMRFFLYNENVRDHYCSGNGREIAAVKRSP